MDHDAHVKAYRQQQIRKAIEKAATAYVLHRYLWGVPARRKRWTWKNHLANWINKTLNLLEKWGL